MAQSSPMPTVTNEDESAEFSRSAWEDLGSSPLDRAKRSRNDRIKARSPLMEVCRMECQNTAYDRNQSQIDAICLLMQPLIPGVNSTFPR